MKLYEDFTRSHAKKNVDKSVLYFDDSSNTKSSTSPPVKKSNQGATHIFQVNRTYSIIMKFNLIIFLISFILKLCPNLFLKNKFFKWK